MSGIIDELLVELHRDGALGPAEQASLAARLAADEPFRRRFIAEARLQGTLAGLLGGGADGSSLLEAISQQLDRPQGASGSAVRTDADGAARRPVPRTRPGQRRQRRAPWGGAGLLAAGVAVAAGIWWLARPGHQRQEPPPVPASAVASKEPSAPALGPVLATLSAIEGGIDGPLAGSPAGAAIHAGERLTTRGDGRARIALADGTSIMLAPGSSLSLALDNLVQVQLDRGQLAAEVAKQAPGHPLIFLTPDARAEVVGTQLSLAVTPGGSRLTVEEGLVRLSMRTGDGPAPGRSWEIGAGEAGETRAGGVLRQALDLAPAPWAADLAAVIRPTAAESAADAIPWMTDLWAARRRARSQGRLLVVWSGWGHPLGMANADCLIDRHQTWADPGIQATIAARCVPVAVDSWFLHQEADAIGRFYDGLVAQSPHPHGITQGIYLCDAEGGLRGFLASGAALEEVRAALDTALAQGLSASDAPLAGPGPLDRIHDPVPGADALVLLASARTVIVLPAGVHAASDQLGPIIGAPGREYLWLAREQWQRLIPAAPAWATAWTCRRIW